MRKKLAGLFLCLILIVMLSACADSRTKNNFLFIDSNGKKVELGMDKTEIDRIFEESGRGSSSSCFYQNDIDVIYREGKSVLFHISNGAKTVLPAYLYFNSKAQVIEMNKTTRQEVFDWLGVPPMPEGSDLSDPYQRLDIIYAYHISKNGTYDKLDSYMDWSNVPKEDKKEYLCLSFIFDENDICKYLFIGDAHALYYAS